MLFSTPARMKRLLDKIDSNNLQVIFDPVNLINIENYKRQDEVISESFELFDDKIVIIHAKDFQIKDGELLQVAPGEGMLNYKLLCDLISK